MYVHTYEQSSVQRAVDEQVDFAQGEEAQVKEAKKRNRYFHFLLHPTYMREAKTTT